MVPSSHRVILTCAEVSGRRAVWVMASNYAPSLNYMLNLYSLEFLRTAIKLEVLSERKLYVSLMYILDLGLFSFKDTLKSQDSLFKEQNRLPPTSSN